MRQIDACIWMVYGGIPAQSKRTISGGYFKRPVNSCRTDRIDRDIQSPSICNNGKIGKNVSRRRTTSSPPLSQIQPALRYLKTPLPLLRSRIHLIFLKSRYPISNISHSHLRSRLMRKCSPEQPVAGGKPDPRKEGFGSKEAGT